MQSLGSRAEILCTYGYGIGAESIPSVCAVCACLLCAYLPYFHCHVVSTYDSAIEIRR